jgi:hypothetical protein
MKRIAPLAVVVTVAILAATVAKRRDATPLPERPKGDWEPDGAGTTS